MQIDTTIRPHNNSGATEDFPHDFYKPNFLRQFTNSLTINNQKGTFMKQHIKIFTRFFVVAVVALFVFATGAMAQGTLLFNENFDYTAGTTAVSNGWTAHSGGGTNSPLITSPGLIYSGYANSNVGNAVTITNTGEDISKMYATQYSGSVYTSVLVNVSNASTGAAGDYIYHFRDSAGAFFGRVHLRKAANSKFQFGISKGSSTTAANISFSDSIYSSGITYLLVMKYKYTAGTTNDTVYLWVNPALGGAEPAPQLTNKATDIALTDATNHKQIAIRQNSASFNVTFDGIRVSDTWDSVATYDASKVISSSSDIQAAGNETSNIDYAAYQLGAIGATTDAVRVWSFSIRDGGGSPDTDLLGTILTGVTIDKGSSNGITNWANTIRQAALYNGSTEVAEVSVTSETITFSGLSGANVTAADDGSVTLDLYLTFETSAVDNSQYQFQITNANVSAGSSGSSFSAFSAQTSSTTSDANRIEVAASKLTFTTNPAASVAQNVDFSATVTAQDANNNTDLDFTGNVTIGVQTGAGAVSAVSGLTKAATSGVVGWTDLQYNTAENGVQLDANSGLLTEGVSSSFNIVALSALSDIIAGPNGDPVSISSLVDTQGEQVEVFDITVRDGGGSPDPDGVGTIITQIVFGQSGFNTAADWSQYIQGAELFNGLTSLGTGAVGATTITFSNSPLVATADDGNVDLQLKIYLNTTMPAGAEGVVLGFKVNQNTDVTISASGSLFAGGGSDVAGSTPISVVATELHFGANIANQTSTVPFATSVKATDVNGNVDEDYASTVTLTISSGSGALSGTTSQAASAGTASFSGVIVTGSGDHVLDAGDGSLLTSSNIFNVVLPAAPAVFKIANYPLNNFKAREVNVVDTLDWDNTSIWTQVSGNDLNNLPDADDQVILDNTFKSGSYVIKAGATARDTCKQLTIGYSGNTNSIGLIVPRTSTLDRAISIGDFVNGNYDLVVEQGGFMKNLSGATTGIPVFLKGGGTAEPDSVQVRNGGLYVHGSTRSATGILTHLSGAPGTETGTIEIDIPGTSNQFPRFDAVFGHLILSASDVPRAYTTGGFGIVVPMNVRGNLTINPGVTWNTSNAGGFQAAARLQGDLINYGTINTVSPTVFEFVGTADQQAIIGNPIVFNAGLTVDNPYNVAMQTDVSVAGGTATITNGSLLTVDDTLYLNPAGSLVETGGAVVGYVSATRTASQSVNENFGGIGFEINALGAAPGLTTILRKTGEQMTGNSNVSVRRYFDVTPTVNSGLNATTVIKYHESELNGKNESDTLFLHKSTDGGATWTGKLGTHTPGVDKVTTNGIQSMARFTLSTKPTPLYVTHIITMRKYEDADGDLGTAGTLKKWYMELYESSIAPENLVNSGNFNTVNTDLLAAGMYIAKEADSSGWVHVGTIVDNGSGAVTRYSTQGYDTIVVGGAVPGTVDFYNSKVSSITINKFRDHDGDAGTTADQSAKAWGLSLYKNAVSGSPVAEGNTESP